MGTPATDGIDFTIIVPTRDRPAQLAACLRALADLRYPRSRFEVIVVDDGSRELVEPVVEQVRGQIQISVQKQRGSGPAAARNLGAACARGKYLAFADDDCAPEPDWLDRLAARLAEAPNAAVGGRTINGLENNVFSAASQALLSYLYEYFNNDPTKPWFLATCNFALDAKIFHSVGGFERSYPCAAGEDRDLSDRLRLKGHPMAYAPDAVVRHRHPLTLASFWTQHFRYGRGARIYRREHRKRWGSDVRFEPLRFYWGMLSWPLRQEGLRAPLVVSALMALSQAANAAGFFWEWWNEKRGRSHAERR